MTRLLQKLSMACLAAVATLSVSAQSFDKQAATISWAVGNESEGTLSDGISDAVSLSKVTVGTDLSVTSTAATYKLGDVTAGPMVTYQPATSNAGCVSTDLIEYTVQVKKGLTFTPTSVSFDAVKEGTDGAYFSWSYTVDGVESDIIAYSSPKTQIRRNNNANPTAPLNHDEAIEGANGGQKVTLRLYISNTANNKKMSIGNVKINGTIDGSVAVRTFKDFSLDFRTDPYTGELPQGVTVNATFHDAQHGYTGSIVVPVDGPVQFTVAGCQYGSDVTVTNAAGEVIATLATNAAGCDSKTSTDKYVKWTYNSETAETLTFKFSYMPYFSAAACDLIPMRTVTYYGLDGKTILGSEEVEGGSALKYKYGSDDVLNGIVGVTFRGWFNSTQASAVKVAEGTSVQDNLSLYAKATAPEVPTVGDIYTYPLNSTSFYPEDHEAFSTTGKFHDGQHGYSIGKGGNIKVQTAGNAVIVLGLCKYTAEGNVVVTDANGNTVGEASARDDNDGATASFTYVGEPTILTATFANGAYIHNVTVYNVANVPEKNAAGYYAIESGDAASLQLVIASLKDGDKIYLPNGTYNFGQKALTTISANNVSVIGESMDGTIIMNAPDVSTEGIGTTATLLNTSSNLYIQDLTIQNALDYYKSGSAGRAVCLQDKGANTICKNVKMLSYQDTYYSNKASKFYWEDSEIHGTVDYLCGDGDVVYNRCKFVNESRSASGQSGSDVLCAPYQSASCTWGYVFLDCSVESLCKDFTFARSWGGNSAAQFIRTKITDNSLNAGRWTTAGMNVAAYKFTEFGTMDADGNVTTPESNVVTFTHSSGNKTYETVLSADEAANYTVANIYGDWNPDQIAAQVTEVPAQGGVFLMDGKIVSDGPVYGKVRIANARGGFGPEVTLSERYDFNLHADVIVDGTVSAYEEFDNQNVTVYKQENGTCTVLLPANETGNYKMEEAVLENVYVAQDADGDDFYSVFGSGYTLNYTVKGEPYTAKQGTIDADQSYVNFNTNETKIFVKAAYDGGTITVIYSGAAPTSVSSVASASSSLKDGKYAKNGQVVIVKNGRRYNALGVEMK